MPKRAARDRARRLGGGPGLLWVNERGNTLLQVIVLLFVLVVGVYFLSDKLITQKNVVLQTSSMLRVRFALHSIVDYMYYHIQRRACLDENLLPAASCQLGTMQGGALANTTSDLLGGSAVLAGSGGKARSLERVLLSKNLAHNMESMIDLYCVDLMLERNLAPNGTTPQNCHPRIGNKDGNGNLVYNEQAIMAVDTLEIVTPAKNIVGGMHPLAPVLDPVYRALNDELTTKTGGSATKHDFYVRVNVHRDTEGNPPVSGSETYFLVTVQLEDENHKLLIANRVPLKTQSYGTIFPREVGSFALMVPRNLRLDDAPVAAPDIAIPPLAGWSAAVAGPGLVFQSPVFVNGNLHLPRPPSGGTHYGGAPKFSPVTFGDRVVLGNGWIYDGNQLYTPDSAGGKHDVFWADNRTLAGLKAGALIDNAWDKGLIKYGDFDVGSFSNQLFQDCLARTATTGVAQPNAVLYASPQSGHPANTLDWILGIVEPAKVTATSRAAVEFNPQKWPGELSSQGVWDAAGGSGTAGNSVARVKLTVGDQSVVADMALGSTLTITPAVGDQTSTASVTAILAGDYSSSPQLQALKQAATSTSTSTATSTSIDPSTAKAALKRLLEAYKKPGQIKVTVQGVHYETDKIDNPPSDKFPLYEKHLVELKASFTHPENFLDGHGIGNLMTPQLQVTGYDPRYLNNAPKAAGNHPENTVRTLKLVNDASGVSLAPQWFYLPDGVTPVPASSVKYGSGPDQFLITDEYHFHSNVNYDGAAYLNFDLQCTQSSGKATGQSFGAAAWNVDFAPDGAHMRTSWNAANDTTVNYDDSSLWTGSWTNGNDEVAPTPHVGELFCPSGNSVCQAGDDCTKKYAMCDVQFDAGNSAIGGVPHHPAPLDARSATDGRSNKRDDFRAFTIVKYCHIENDAELVAGFFTCDTLEIKGGRTKPLYIIGTFIVRELNIDSSVMAKGVHWMSIYHPDAVGILRSSRVLRRMSSTALCDDNSFTGHPIWDLSGMRLADQSDMRSCNVISLRAKSDNFRWTAVDPDCGPPPNGTGSGSTCKRHPVNYLVMEHGRGGGP